MVQNPGFWAHRGPPTSPRSTLLHAIASLPYMGALGALYTPPIDPPWPACARKGAELGQNCPKGPRLRNFGPLLLQNGGYEALAACQSTHNIPMNHSLEFWAGGWLLGPLGAHQTRPREEPYTKTKSSGFCLIERLKKTQNFESIA